MRAALDLAIEGGNMDGIKSRIAGLRAERDHLARQHRHASRDMPSVDELMPAVRDRLRDLEATLKADLPQGRMALGALLGDQRIRVCKDGRLDGIARLEPETESAGLRSAPETGTFGGSGGLLSPRVPRVSIPLELPVEASRAVDASA